ncbi:MAG: hypothetical protein ACTS43_01135 [Candidatus Hodgkinia cicadicola]
MKGANEVVISLAGNGIGSRFESVKLKRTSPKGASRERRSVLIEVRTNCGLREEV